MSTIDQSGAIHDAKGRFAGHVAAESTTGLCAELIHDEPQPILTAMPEIEELQRQRDEICRTIDEAKWRANAAQVKHDYPTAESIAVSFDREDRIYHLDAVLAADEQPLYNSLDFDAVSDETLDIALVGGDAHLDAVGARDYPGQTLFGGGQVLPLDRLATIGRSQDSDPPELPDFGSTDDALNERVLSICTAPDSGSRASRTRTRRCGPDRCSRSGGAWPATAKTWSVTTLSWSSSGTATAA